MNKHKTRTLLFIMVSITACFSSRAQGQSSSGSVQADVPDNVPAFQNTQINSVIVWQAAQFTPGDPNAWGQYVSTYAPQHLLELLNNGAAADGNSFVISHDATFLINVFEYSDRNATSEHRSLRADVWIMGHSQASFSVSTLSYDLEDNDSMMEDLANKICYWFHNGWHTN